MKDYSHISDTTKSDLSHVHLGLSANPNLVQAESAARKALGSADKGTFLVAWWDNKSKRGSPMEACSSGSAKCSRDYARSHHASTRVTINDGRYEFYYGDVPAGHQQLQKDLAVALRRGFESIEMRGVIGG